MSFPKYEYFIADEKYTNLARKNGLYSNSKEEAVEALIQKIKELNQKLEIPKSLQELGMPN